MSELYEVVSASRAATQRLVALAQEYALTVAVAIVVFLVAYDNGGFGESTRDTVGIILWWVLVLCVGLGVWPLARIPRAAWVTGGLLAAFGLWTLLSVFWAADAAGAYGEFTRVMLYVAGFAVTVAGSRRANAARWCNGLAVGIAAVAGIALISRLFPGTLGNEAIARLIPEGQNRLSYPVGYWNGLAIFGALGIPLLLRASIASRSIVARGLALVPIPVIAADIYLASSRTGTACAVLGAVTFVLLTNSRWNAFAASAVAAAGSAAVVIAVSNRNTLVNGPLASPKAASEGHSAFLLILGICILTGLIYGVGLRATVNGPRVRSAVGWTVFGAAVVLVVAGIVLAHPVRRFEAFKAPPAALDVSAGVEQHLASGSGNGRWQMWQVAWKEFETEPLHGGGAGSYEAWWARHGEIPGFVQDAHSLYVETLGELGVVGLALLVLTFASGFVVAGRRLLRASGDQRVALAAATASFFGYAVGVSADWMWELTIVSLVAFGCLGLMVGPATAVTPGPRPVEPAEPAPRPRLYRYGIGVGVIVVGWLAICAIAVPLIAGARLSDSQRAARRGDLATGVRAALDARSIQPWSPAPYQQIALLQEEAGNYTSAASWIRRALRRDVSDWRLWLARTRIEAAAGNVAAARRSLRMCRALNPRSPLCRGA